MRDTKDIADAVFRIRDEHLEKKKTRIKRIEKACAAVSAAAAVAIITAGAVHFSSFGNKPTVQDTDNIMITDVTAERASEITTAVNDTASSAPLTVYTTAVTSSGKVREVTTVSSTAKGTSSMISSALTKAASAAETTAASQTQTTDIADINENDCMEVIRMKVNNVKKYLAALSAAALASGGVNMNAYAEELYTPNELDPLAESVNYIDENPDLFDLDESGKIDPFDAYALFTYVNEPSSLPEGYAERCEAKGDVNKDGKIDSADSALISEMFIYKFSEEQFRAYYDSYNYLTPRIKNSYEYITRSVSDDAPEDVKEKLKINEFIDSCYPYGSEGNINSFVELCFKKYLNGIEWEECFKYNDAYYKRFADDAKSRNYSFDVNEDGVTDLRDLYDIYIYDVASADDFESSPIVKEEYFMRFNTVTTGEGITRQTNYNHDIKLRELLTLSEDEKQKLWDKCEPIYDYVYSFIDYKKFGATMGNVTVLDLIARYITNNVELDYINTSLVYFMQYRDEVKLCDIPVAKEFANFLNSCLVRNFQKTGDDPTGQKESPKLYTAIQDYDYMNDNEVLRAVNKQAKDEYENGITSYLYDINKDGKIDGFDTYSFVLYISDLRNGITAENSILPADQWNFIDTQIDLDNDGIAGTFIDFMIFTYIDDLFYDVPDYKLDIYYLELVEKKGFTDLSDIRPYIEKLCNGKDAGDVDFDGNVTAVDASKVLNYYAQSSVNAEVSTVTEAQMQYMADLNTDGIVDSVDAAAILSTYAKNSVQG